MAELLEVLGKHEGAAELRSRSLPMSLEEQESAMATADERAEALEEEVRGLTSARDAAEDELMELRDAVRAMLTAWECDVEAWEGSSSVALAAELLEELVTP